MTALLLVLALVPAAQPAIKPRSCRTKACWRRVHHKRAMRWLKRERPWVWRYRQLSAADRRWVVSTGSCESGNRASTNTGNGYSGFLQFHPATARAAGFKRLPHMTSWHEQAVRGVAWRNRTSWRQWPRCGA